MANLINPIRKCLDHVRAKAIGLHRRNVVAVGSASELATQKLLQNNPVVPHTSEDGRLLLVLPYIVDIRCGRRGGGHGGGARSGSHGAGVGTFAKQHHRCVARFLVLGLHGQHVANVAEHKIHTIDGGRLAREIVRINRHSLASGRIVMPHPPMLNDSRHDGQRRVLQTTDPTNEDASNTYSS